MRVSRKRDVDTIYSLTALTAVLTARLIILMQSLYEYIENNCSQTQYTGVEKVLYLAEMSKNYPMKKPALNTV